MDIEIRLFATFRQGRFKKERHVFDQEAIIEDVLDRFGIDEKEVAILLLNGRDANLSDKLKEGDTISLFPPVGGG